MDPETGKPEAQPSASPVPPSTPAPSDLPPSLEYEPRPGGKGLPTASAGIPVAAPGYQVPPGYTAAPAPPYGRGYAGTPYGSGYAAPPPGYAAGPAPAFAPSPGGPTEYYEPLLAGQRPEGYDVEAAAMAGFATAFAEAQVRRAFVRKVLGIVFLQLLVTVAAACVFYYVQPVKMYVQTQIWPFWAAWGLGFAVVIFLSCSTRARRQYPLNLVTLTIFTLAFSIVVGITTSFYDAQVLVAAFGLTAATVGLVFAAATLTDYDFTTMGGAMYMITWAFIFAILIGSFWISDLFILIISTVGAVLFSLWLLMDIQMLMGGRTVAIAPDEYVFAAINIYLDIINIFLNILNMLTAFNRQ
ncbi:hypothetical protein WJX72_006654 [[Myrmecia] bisecta]|uniref:Uncharacterized protein n=1 Tax=[Myrmecia] bisecta TaxID=41462 RepID=A0AAW1QAW5_9CHLO